MILFRSADDKERSWWNIGGWGNTGHALEINGREYPRVSGKIETGRWYDIRVEVREGEILGYLDNLLIQRVKTPARPKLYAVAGSDRASGDLILQVSNPSNVARDLTVALQGLKGGKQARGQVLTSTGPDNRNTLASPDTVAPKEVTVPLEGTSLRWMLPAWSHTVLRVPR